MWYKKKKKKIVAQEKYYSKGKNWAFCLWDFANIIARYHKQFARYRKKIMPTTKNLKKEKANGQYTTWIRVTCVLLNRHGKNDWVLLLAWTFSSSSDFALSKFWSWKMWTWTIFFSLYIVQMLVRFCK